jgi:hypothetical protein
LFVSFSIGGPTRRDLDSTPSGANNARGMILESATIADDRSQVALLHTEGATNYKKLRKPALRFSLRNLFSFITAAGVLLAICSSCEGGGYAPIAVLLAVSVVLLHLISTVVGNNLRSEADKQTGVFRSFGDTASEQIIRAPLARDITPSPLHTRGRTMRWLPMVVLAGAAVGGCLGAILLEAIVGGRTTAVGVAVGALSTAVLGAWFAFLGGNFWSILHKGWRDAVAEHKTS